MTEAEWGKSKDPEAMLAFLDDRASQRKARLLACGCCRRVWEGLTDPRSRAGVETAEKFADGQARRSALTAAHKAAEAAGRTVCKVVAQRLNRQYVAESGKEGRLDPSEPGIYDPSQDASSATEAVVYATRCWGDGSFSTPLAAGAAEFAAK